MRGWISRILGGGTFDRPDPDLKIRMQGRNSMPQKCFPCGRCRGCSAEYLCSSGSANVVALRPRGGRDGVDAKEDEDAEIGLGGSGTSAGLFNRIAGSLVSDSVERALSAVGVEQYLDNAVKYVKRVLLLRPNGVRYSEEGELEAEDRGIFLNSTGECM